MSNSEINKYIKIIAGALAEHMGPDETVNTMDIVNALINMIMKIASKNGSDPIEVFESAIRELKKMDLFKDIKLDYEQ